MGITTDEESIKATKIRIDKVEVDVWHNSGMMVITPRPVILMIHGMFGGGWYFESWAKFLCENGHFVVYVIKDLHEGEDLRKIDFYDYLEKTIKVAEEICAIEKNKIILIGHSMGGLIAQKIAETKPRLVAGLVLVTSAPPKGISAMSWDVAKAMIKHLFPLLFNLPLKIEKKSTLKLILNWLDDDNRKEQIFQKFVPESSRAVKQLAFSRIPVDHRKFDCRILVVAGGYDKLLPLETQIKISQKYDSELRSFRKGHMLMLEDHNGEIISAIYTWIITHFVY